MCPRPVARRLPLFGRQPCICEHLSGESWWSRTVTLRLLRIASAACCYWHYSPKSGRACRICTGVGQFCGLPDGCSPNARRNRTAAQVTRREKTSLTSVLSDRGLKIGGAGGSCTRTGRIKSPLCLLLTPQLQSGAFGEARTPDSGLADRRVTPTPRTHVNSAPAGLGPPAGFIRIR